uniref:Uncharacterized protein n=1 Tax=Catharus ustulatus TaxID=91951 RepID=A0A8C3TID9_CATUS
MDKGATGESSSNASSASKIKTKLRNNSSMFQVALQQNNKELPSALNAEKENSCKLENENNFLQKEIEKLQLHITFLHQKLNSMNKSLTGIDAFLKENLLTAIQISSPSEVLQSAFPLSTGHNFRSAHQSAQSTESPAKLPFIATADAEQQGNPSLALQAQFPSLISHFHQGKHLPITLICKRSSSAWQSNSRQQSLLNVGSFLYDKAETKFLLVFLDHPESHCGESFPSD